MTERTTIFIAALETDDPAERRGVPGRGLRRRRRPAPAGRAACCDAHDQAGSFLERPGRRPPTVDDRRPAAAESPGTVIGPYKLLQQIGEGGMGAVYMAEQTEPVRRKVALKVIKAGHGHAGRSSPASRPSGRRWR